MKSTKASLLKEEEDMLNWYLQGGKESDVVVSSRIRFARNLSNFPFMTKLDKTAKQKIEEQGDVLF